MARIDGDDAVEFVRKTGLLGGSTLVIVLGIIVALFVLFNCTTRVDTGHVGVLTMFSKVDTSETLPEGLHLINPLKAVHEMSVQTQSRKEAADVPTTEGLMVHLETTLVFHLDRGHAATVYQGIGTGYVETIIEPNLRSAIREITATHSASALYTGAREEVSQKIEAELRRTLTPQGIFIESVLLRDVQLPAMLRQSIEAKQQAEQDALRMSFILQKEKQEAERKRIEAQGISDFQHIVAQGISAQLLEWKGIEATEKLAASPNAKIVIVGNTKNGLPLIFEPH
ncbi:MAG TPA: prohibitin family protein [Candidatus Acidoferrales bacterium]|nr:prohibitin family protein [Candidatus Acidoferrales bacterium]